MQTIARFPTHNIKPYLWENKPGLFDKFYFLLTRCFAHWTFYGRAKKNKKILTLGKKSYKLSLRKLDFERILNSDSQDPDQSFLNLYNCKDSH